MEPLKTIARYVFWPKILTKSLPLEKAQEDGNLGEGNGLGQKEKKQKIGMM